MHPWPLRASQSFVCTRRCAWKEQAPQNRLRLSGSPALRLVLVGSVSGLRLLTLLRPIPTDGASRVRVACVLSLVFLFSRFFLVPRPFFVVSFFFFWSLRFGTGLFVASLTGPHCVGGVGWLVGLLFVGCCLSVVVS